MTSFLFWNVMNRDLRGLIARAVVERDVDIVLVAESGATTTRRYQTTPTRSACSRDFQSTDGLDGNGIR